MVVKKPPKIDPVLEFALANRGELNPPQEDFRSLVRYSFVTDIGEKSNTFIGGCFAAFPTNWNRGGKGSKYLMTQTNPRHYGRGEEGMPLVHRYVDYLINRSIFAEVFVHKDAEDSWKNGFVLDMSFPAQLVVSAAIYARYAREQWRWVADFNACLDAGIPEDEAFVAMMFYRSAPITKDITPSVAFGGHTVLMQGTFTKTAFKNLLNKTYSENAPINSTPCNQLPKYAGIARLFSDHGDDLTHPSYTALSVDQEYLPVGFRRPNVYALKALKGMWEMFKAHNLPVEKEMAA